MRGGNVEAFPVAVAIDNGTRTEIPGTQRDTPFRRWMLASQVHFRKPAIHAFAMSQIFNRFLGILLLIV